MKKIIGIIMILVGSSLIIFTSFIKYKVYKNQKDMINAFQHTINDVDKERAHTDNSTTKSKDLDMIKDVIGIITIPKINLEAAICQGIEIENLKYAVGHFPGTPLPEKKGNFCIAGHRSYTYGEFFNRLDELETGDEIIVKTETNQYKYKVYEKKVVEPFEISVLDNTKSSIITLVTCTPIRIATHRLIIKGNLE